MTIAKAGDCTYINVDRMTYIEPGRKGKLVVHSAVGSSDGVGPSCRMRLEEDEATRFKQWLDTHSQTAHGGRSPVWGAKRGMYRFQNVVVGSEFRE